MNDSVFIAGLDLGQSHDYTALAILERQQVQRQRLHGFTDPPPVYRVRHLQRFPLHTRYPAIVAELQTILAQPPLKRREVFLAVDRTGCGAAVCDMLFPVFPDMTAITITGGEHGGRGPNGFTVPKRDLAGILQVLLQSRRLQVAKELPEAPQLVQELQTFKVKINIATGNESFEAWREKDRDDLVLAVAIAAWLGEQMPRASFAPTVYEVRRPVYDY